MQRRLTCAKILAYSGEAPSNRYSHGLRHRANCTRSLYNFRYPARPIQRATQMISKNISHQVLTFKGAIRSGYHSHVHFATKSHVVPILRRAILTAIHDGNQRPEFSATIDGYYLDTFPNDLVT